jgi:hypothetical protein
MVGPTPIEADVWSPRSLQTQAKWVQDCINNHPSCPEAEAQILPTRLVEVGEPSSGYSNVRLHLSKPGETGQYLALSYVWGTQWFTDLDPFRTTESNIDQFTSEIPTPIPQTIADAIRATRNLGFQFIWIDALCIIQDSEEDKRKEITKMRSIYQNAFMTISVANSYSVYGGFPEPVGQRREKPPINLNDHKETIGCVNITLELQTRSEKVEHIQLFPRNNFTNDCAPLNTRAWTMQESMISSRVLVCTETGLRWMCCKGTWVSGGSESSIQMPPLLANIQQMIENVEKKMAEMRLPLRYSISEHLSITQAHFEWEQIVMDYGRRECSDPRDKFSAIAGIAEQFESLFAMGEYVAGFWKECLLRGLCWWNGFGGSPSREDMPWRAPSWSWASIKGPTTLYYTSLDSLQACASLKVLATVQRIDVHTVPGTTQFGPLESGSLTLHGPLRPFEFRDEPEDEFQEPPARNVWFGPNNGGYGTADYENEITKHDDKIEAGSAELLALALYTTVDKGYQAHGLLVARWTEGDMEFCGRSVTHGAFIRVGVFATERYPSEDELNEFWGQEGLVQTIILE